MTVDYNNFSKTFAASRKNMKWPELEYFFSKISSGEGILDIGCGSGRLLEQYNIFFGEDCEQYLGVDLSQGLLEEGRKMFPGKNFIEANMTEIPQIVKIEDYKSIFFIASYHHLRTLSEREELLKKISHQMKQGSKVFMTNWALDSDMNKIKYSDSKILGSENEFASSDYTIKFGEFDRFYHCFSLRELEYLAERSGLKIIENRLFENQKNYITILEK